MAHGFGVIGGTCGPPRAATSASPCDLLRVAVAEPLDGVLVITPAGEIDVSTAGVLRRATHEAVEAEPRGVVVDLSGLTFCGSTGLVTLMDAREHAERRGVAFGTAGGRPIVLRVLEITGFGPVLGHRETLDAALGAAGSGAGARS
jgi:stage II sporulation protein AA (anti-sigma F factor antagonist)